MPSVLSESFKYIEIEFFKIRWKGMPKGHVLVRRLMTGSLTCYHILRRIFRNLDI